MYNLFNGWYHDNISAYKWPDFNLIRRTYLKELYVIQNYYHNRVYAVKSNHFLCNLLNNLNVPMEYSNDRYVEVCRTRMDFISRAINMTSETHFGKLHNGVFYGPGCTELIYSVDEYFDIDSVVDNWQNVCAVRPLIHPRSDLKLMLPNGKKSGNEIGLASIAVNIPMLALQYKMFSLDQYRKFQMTGSMLGVTHFVHMYVLPNMMGPHIDIVVLNRLMNLFYGKPMGIAYFKHAFPIIDYSQKIDLILNKLLHRLETDMLTDETIITDIPSIYENTMLNSLQMPDFAPTRQIWWSLILTRLGVMKFLVDVGNYRSNKLNMTSIRNLQIEFRHLKRDNIYTTVLPKDLAFDVLNDIDDILKI